MALPPAADGGLFSPASLTSSGRPVLLPDEVERHTLPGVDLEPQPSSSNFPPFKSGLLILTTHRLLWLPAAQGGSAPVSIPLSAVTHIFSLKKSIKAMFHSPRVRFQVSGGVVVTAVVRGKGGDLDLDGFLGKFWECWRGRAWVVEVEEDKKADSGSGGFYSSDGSVRMLGVAGILRKEQEIWESNDKSLQDAFQDLNALMSKAKEMGKFYPMSDMLSGMLTWIDLLKEMMLADKMRQKLLSGPNSQVTAGNDEEMVSREEMQD